MSPNERKRRAGYTMIELVLVVALLGLSVGMAGLNAPLHVNGPRSTPNLYDVDFNDATNLPPMTPRFVYLKQELFVRQYAR